MTDYTARKKQRGLQDNTAYSNYVASPYSFGSLTIGNLSSSLILPANSFVGVSCSIDTTDDVFSVYVNGVERSQKANTANVISKLGFLYKPYSVQLKAKSGLTACTINLYHYDYWNRPVLIASGSLS